MSRKYGYGIAFAFILIVPLALSFATIQNPNRPDLKQRTLLTMHHDIDSNTVVWARLASFKGSDACISAAEELREATVRHFESVNRPTPNPVFPYVCIQGN